MFIGRDVKSFIFCPCKVRHHAVKGKVVSELAKKAYGARGYNNTHF
jgi:hypothetical protein